MERSERTFSALPRRCLVRTISSGTRLSVI
jgi:hypothetical protein